jgi:hypothetical protein
LIEHFVSGSTARTAASLVGVNKSTAAFIHPGGLAIYTWEPVPSHQANAAKQNPILPQAAENMGVGELRGLLRFSGAGIKAN